MSETQSQPIITEEQDTQFSASIDAMAVAIQQRNADKGFWDQGIDRNKGEMIALLHSEASEMLETVRCKTMPQSEKIPEFTGEEEELADLVIRCLDYAAGFKLRLGEAVIAKLRYNASRPHKHGKSC